MRSLMKLALDSRIPLDTDSHCSSPCAPPTDAIALFGLRKNLSICRILLFLCKKIFGRQPIPIRSASNTYLMPLIKATTRIQNCGVNKDLTGKSVLCVGGRSKYYPTYQRLVEDLGGRLMTFHGNANDSIDQLYAQLNAADLMICPIDCVNHEAYFTVKRYCKYFGKPCVFLDRSQIATFQNGIKTLTSMAAKKERPEGRF